MITQDILIYEAGSGGELSVQNNDIALIEQLYNQVYLAWFGGNIEASTLGNETPDEIRNDWWGNSLLFPNDPGSQFNSQTEKALRDNALNSSGRINIQRSAEADLQYLKSIADVTVNVVILSTNKVQLSATLSQPKGAISQTVSFIWDNAKNELIQPDVII